MLRCTGVQSMRTRMLRRGHVAIDGRGQRDCFHTPRLEAVARAGQGRRGHHGLRGESPWVAASGGREWQRCPRLPHEQLHRHRPQRAQQRPALARAPGADATPRLVGDCGGVPSRGRRCQPASYRESYGRWRSGVAAPPPVQFLPAEVRWEEDRLQRDGVCLPRLALHPEHAGQPWKQHPGLVASRADLRVAQPTGVSE